MIAVYEHDDRFRIGASSIEGAGYGLFAAKDIPKGSFLEVIGVQVKRGSVADQCTAFADRYKFLASDDTFVVIPMGWGAMVNHSDDKGKQNVEIRNQKAKPPEGEAKEILGEWPLYSGEVVYYFLRDVAEGEEILGYYGSGFDARQATLGGLGEEAEQDKAWEEVKAMGLYGLDRLDKLLGREQRPGDGGGLVLMPGGD